MSKKYNVYSDYCELFITSKKLKKPYTFLQSFKSLPDAIDYCNATEDWWLVTKELKIELEKIYDYATTDFINEHTVG